MIKSFLYLYKISRLSYISSFDKLKFSAKLSLFLKSLYLEEGSITLLNISSWRTLFKGSLIFSFLLIYEQISSKLSWWNILERKIEPKFLSNDLYILISSLTSKFLNGILDWSLMMVWLLIELWYLFNFSLLISSWKYLTGSSTLRVFFKSSIYPNLILILETLSPFLTLITFLRRPLLASSRYIKITSNILYHKRTQKSTVLKRKFDNKNTSIYRCLKII